MTYPDAPYGQGFPEQPGQQPPAYPPPPVYPQQHPPPPGYLPPPPGYHGGPPPGYPQQPYGPPPTLPANPSGATAIIAGILAGLGGIANFFGGLAMAFGLSVITQDSGLDTGSAEGAWTALIAITLLNIVAGVLLLAGTVTLLLRKMVGRWLVAVACGVSIVSSVISLSLSSMIVDYEYGNKASEAVGLIFPITTLVLVLLPSTAAWIRAKQNPVAPQFYPPYPG